MKHTSWGEFCWWLAWKAWPFKTWNVVRTWGTRQWVAEKQRRHAQAARMLLASGWDGGYCYVDGNPYTLKVYPGHLSAIDAARKEPT